MKSKDTVSGSLLLQGRTAIARRPEPSQKILITIAASALMTSAISIGLIIAVIANSKPTIRAAANAIEQTGASAQVEGAR